MSSLIIEPLCTLNGKEWLTTGPSYLCRLRIPTAQRARAVFYSIGPTGARGFWPSQPFFFLFFFFSISISCSNIFIFNLYFDFQCKPSLQIQLKCITNKKYIGMMDNFILNYYLLVNLI